MPLAVLCYDDADAARLMNMCRLASIDVPREIAVLGIGNDPLICLAQHMPISAVGQQLEASAYAAAVRLDQLMSLPYSRRRRCGPPQLIQPTDISSRESSDTLAHDNPRIREALIHIHRNLGTAFGAAEIAEAIGIGRHELDRLFAAELHHSVGSEIFRQRLIRAKRLLADPSITIGSIAEACGFCNAAYFTNSFIKAEGVTPREWRRANA